MALLVDGGVNGVEDLKEWDSGLLDVADGEGMDLRAKLTRAQAEIEEEVEGFLRWEGQGEVGQVQVDRALRRWHALRTIEAVYRDAYFSQLNDRYGAKWKHYAGMAEEQGRRYLEGGVAVVWKPLRRPAALDVVVGDGTNAAATYWLQATAVDAEGNESAPGEMRVESSPLPHSLTARLPYGPAGAVGWNLYAGVQEGETTLQNGTLLQVSESWVLPETGVTTGRPPGEGQAADGVIRRGGVLRRG